MSVSRRRATFSNRMHVSDPEISLSEETGLVDAGRLGFGIQGSGLKTPDVGAQQLCAVCVICSKTLAHQTRVTTGGYQEKNHLLLEKPPVAVLMHLISYTPYKPYITPYKPYIYIPYHNIAVYILFSSV